MPIYKANGKKDGLQKYNVRVNYVNGNGEAKQLTRTAYGSDAAKDLERRLIVEIKDKNEIPAKKMTMQQLFDEYIAAKKYEVRESTIDKDKRNYRLYLLPMMSNVRIDKLTIQKLQEWKRSIEEKDLALKTRNHAYSLFRAILNYALKMEYIQRNPLPIVGNFKDALYTKAEMLIYTAQEFTQYISTVKMLAEERQAKHSDLSEWEYYVLFNIAFYTGLRKGEAYVKQKLKNSEIFFSDLDYKTAPTKSEVRFCC